MPLTLHDWLLIISSIAVSALLIFLLRSKGSSSWRLGDQFQGTARMLIVPAAAFLLIAGIGAATSYFRDAPEAAGSAHTISFSPSRSGLDGEMLSRLNDYARSTGTEEHGPEPPAGKLLPDVKTMIERLSARLETTPEDIKGWRTLGWSYFNMGQYELAATAYARAVELDPNSAELKLSYEEAKAKSSGLRVAKDTKPEATPPHGHEASIRSMVDGLANRLERSPRDVEGWTRLMRSRVVLGEREVAATALRKALEVFKEDQEASGKIRAVANALGLKTD